MQAKVITISQQKGGCGKTTITVQLAVALSQKNYKVAIIDSDPQGSLNQWYNQREKKLGEQFTGLSFITISGWRINNCINEIKYHYDFILIDCPPHTETDAKAAIRVATLVLIPLQPSPTDLWAIKPTIEICKKENKEFKIILNRTTPRNKFIKLIFEHFPNDLLQNSFGNRIAFSNCLISGEAVLENEPKSQASQEVRNLLEEIQVHFENIKIKEKIL